MVSNRLAFELLEARSMMDAHVGFLAFLSGPYSPVEGADDLASGAEVAPVETPEYVTHSEDLLHLAASPAALGVAEIADGEMADAAFEGAGDF